MKMYVLCPSVSFIIGKCFMQNYILILYLKIYFPILDKPVKFVKLLPQIYFTEQTASLFLLRQMH